MCSKNQRLMSQERARHAVGTRVEIACLAARKSLISLATVGTFTRHAPFLIFQIFDAGGTPEIQRARHVSIKHDQNQYVRVPARLCACRVPPLGTSDARIASLRDALRVARPVSNREPLKNENGTHGKRKLRSCVTARSSLSAKVNAPVYLDPPLGRLLVAGGRPPEPSNAGTLGPSTAAGLTDLGAQVARALRTAAFSHKRSGGFSHAA